MIGRSKSHKRASGYAKSAAPTVRWRLEAGQSLTPQKRDARSGGRDAMPGSLQLGSLG